MYKRQLALRGQLFSLLCQCGGQGEFGLDEGGIAGVDVHAVQLGRQTIARQGCEVSDFRGSDGLCLGVGQNCLCQRVLAAAFQRCGQRQQLRLGDALSGQQVGDAGCALGDGAGLVQRHDLGAACGFQDVYKRQEQLKAVSTYDGAEIFEEISEKGA